MRYTALASGTVNDRPLRISGSGHFEMPLGLVVGEYLIQEVPPGFDTLLLNSVLITGYPSVCRHVGKAKNPFAEASYRYSREIRFSTGETLAYSADCVIENGNLKSSFALQGHVPTVSLGRTLPVTEIWRQSRGNAVYGEFEIVWETLAGSSVSARAQTHYTPAEGSAPLQTDHHRSIIIENRRPAPSILQIRQESSLSELLV